MLNNIFIFIVALYMVIKGSIMATKYSGRLAQSFNISKYMVGFMMVAIISILPETLISINAALTGIPSFGLGMLFGSNIADLTLVFAVIVFVAGRSIKVESKILKNQPVYPFILLVPLILGLNGHLSRIEGIALIVIGIIFYYLTLRDNKEEKHTTTIRGNKTKNTLWLLFSMTILLL